EILVDRLVERRKRKPMERTRDFGEKSACMLVLSLRSAFEALDAALDAELQRLVVAGLEVESRDELDAAPIASVKRGGREEVEGGRDGPPLLLGDHEQHLVPHALADHPEEGAIEIWGRPVLGVGAPVAAVEEIPILDAG